MEKKTQKETKSTTHEHGPDCNHAAHEHVHDEHCEHAKAEATDQAQAAEDSTTEQAAEAKTDYFADLQRMQAEFDNYKKRTAKEQEQARAKAEERIIKEILPIIDNYTLALQNHSGKDDFTKGIELIYAQFMELLKNHNITRMKSLGVPFNPLRHEALMTRKEEGKKENSIIEVLQEGYVCGEKIMRSAKVIVNK